MFCHIFTALKCHKVGKIARFKVSDFHDSAKFTKLSLHKMFSPKQNRGNFEGNHKKINHKIFDFKRNHRLFFRIILPLYGKPSVVPFCHILIALAKAHNKRYCFY